MTVRFRGRELTHPELGRNLLARFVDRVKEHGVAERTPLLEGKSMHITMASLHKPKATTHRHREAPTERTKTDAAPDDRRRTDRRPPTAGSQRRRRRRPRHRPKPQPTEARPEPAPAAGRSSGRRGRRTGRRLRGDAVAETRSEPNQSTPAPEPVTSGE